VTEEQRLQQQRGRLYPEVDGGEKACTLISTVEYPGDERLLLEVEERRYPGHEKHEQCDSDQVGRARHLGEGSEDSSPDATLGSRQRARVGSRCRGRCGCSRRVTALAADHLHHEQ